MNSLAGIAVCPLCKGSTIDQYGEDCKCGTGVISPEPIDYKTASAYIRWYKEQERTK